MAITDNKKNYMTEWQMASYLEAEWSDFLFMQSSQERNSLDPITNFVCPSFYQEVAQLTRQWLGKESILPKKYLDIGGATGRTLYEIYHSFSTLVEMVLVEPSPKFCGWARKIIFESEELGYIPIVFELQKPSYEKALSRPDPLQQSSSKSIYIYEGFAESVPRPSGYFDLITCLNVVDRHPNPKALVQILYDLLTPNGILVFASPMDFNDTFTPDRNQWVSNLNVLFSDEYWNSVGDGDVLYDFRYFRRRFIRFASQVVAKQKR